MAQGIPEDQIATIPDQIETKFINNRITQKKFQETAQLNLIKNEYIALSNLEVRQPQFKVTCLCHKYGQNVRCEKCSEILPSVTSNGNPTGFYGGSIVQKSPLVTVKNGYHHSQKHVSEKFQ